MASLKFCPQSLVKLPFSTTSLTDIPPNKQPFPTISPISCNSFHISSSSTSTCT
ncbi:hypothetical protein [Wolbachia endosymbiont (group A) of Trypoxylon clavicerum]|uniref:hypothetical protein n=1 Tax=Wolbachia endosymbiont (group A) of Trypoxylon clavicerum TaxID=2954064 RepID=UPI00222E3969|nr:hypothetical protein [Wolbachia endosymbiont (group A) of Trypoxylon clavicerum]